MNRQVLSVRMVAGDAEPQSGLSHGVIKLACLIGERLPCA